MHEAVNAVAGHLSRIFRHMLPGIVAVGFAFVAHRGWFQGMDWSNGFTLALLAAIALTGGNVLFVVHRYIIQQAIDYVVYIARTRKMCGYVAWLRVFVCDCMESQEHSKDIRDHIWNRASHLIFLSIVLELSWVFLFWHSRDAPFVGSEKIIYWINVAGTGSVIWQNYLLNQIEIEAVERYQSKLSVNVRD